MAQARKVAIPIPSGEGQNQKAPRLKDLTIRRSQYLYLLVKVRTKANKKTLVPRAESQYLYLLVKVRTTKR